jgi:hypothetical protein
MTASSLEVHAMASLVAHYKNKLAGFMSSRIPT